MNQEEENLKIVCQSERPKRRPTPDEPYRKIQQHSEKQQLKQTQNEKLRRRRCRQPYLLLLFPKVILQYIGKTGLQLNFGLSMPIELAGLIGKFLRFCQVTLPLPY